MTDNLILGLLIATTVLICLAFGVMVKIIYG